jgi:hypothetical protein
VQYHTSLSKSLSVHLADVFGTAETCIGGVTIWCDHGAVKTFECFGACRIDTCIATTRFRVILSDEGLALKNHVAAASILVKLRNSSFVLAFIESLDSVGLADVIPYESMEIRLFLLTLLYAISAIAEPCGTASSSALMRPRVSR